jgi:hypothetical protein
VTVKECTAILAPLALSLGAELDEPTFRAYHKALDDVSMPLLRSAAESAARQERRFMPSAGELRGLAEVRRRELMEAHPYERCAACNHTGNRSIPNTFPPKYRRCECWEQYQTRLAELGISDQPLALPSAREFTAIGERE